MRQKCVHLSPTHVETRAELAECARKLNARHEQLHEAVVAGMLGQIDYAITLGRYSHLYVNYRI